MNLLAPPTRALTARSRSVSNSSFRLQPCPLGDLGPFGDLAAQMRAERFGRTADQAKAEFCRALLHVGVGEDFVGVGIDLGDNGGRLAGRREQRVPAGVVAI